MLRYFDNSLEKSFLPWIKLKRLMPDTYLTALISIFKAVMCWPTTILLDGVLMVVM